MRAAGDGPGRPRRLRRIFTDPAAQAPNGERPSPYAADARTVTAPFLLIGPRTRAKRQDHIVDARLWSSVTGIFGAIVGIAPPVLHHVGPLVGTALVVGAGGTVLFGALGLARVRVDARETQATLRQLVGILHRPGIVFAVMFTLAAAVIGPWISGSTDPAQPAVTENVVHDVHHES